MVKKEKNPDAMRVILKFRVDGTMVYHKDKAIDYLKSLIDKKNPTLFGGIHISRVEQIESDVFEIENFSSHLGNGLKSRDYMIRGVMRDYGTILDEVILMRFYKRSKAKWEKYCVIGALPQSRTLKPFNLYENYSTIHPYVHYGVVPCYYSGEMPWWAKEA